jgi:hypothetical protein
MCASIVVDDDNPKAAGRNKDDRRPQIRTGVLDSPRLDS